MERSSYQVNFELFLSEQMHLFYVKAVIGLTATHGRYGYNTHILVIIEIIKIRSFHLIGLNSQAKHSLRDLFFPSPEDLFTDF